MNKLIILAITVFSLQILGCTTSNIKNDYSFNSKSPKGLLVGSITYDGYYASYIIYLKNLDTNKTQKIEAGGSMTPFHLFDPKGNLDHLGVKGDLFAIELVPGNYEINGWSVEPGTGTYLSSKKPFSIKLVINQGKALYLGSVNFIQTETYGVTISGAKAFYLSQYDRDVSEFRKNYKKVTVPKIKNTLKVGETLALGEDMTPDSEILFNSISFGLSMPTR